MLNEEFRHANQDLTTIFSQTMIPLCPENKDKNSLFKASNLPASRTEINSMTQQSTISTFTNKTLRRLFTALMLLAMIGAAPAAYAKGNYHVEVVIFKQLGSSPGSRPPSFYDLPSYSSTWQSKNVYLNTYANKMRRSGKYEILTHTSWGQKSASYNGSAAKRLTANGLSGYIKVFAKQLLITDVKLSFEGHTLSERRRLKLNEVHYFDNSGFGVLMRVSRT